MAVNDFTGKNIQDTYQRVVQTDGTNLADGTGSLLPISFDGNNVKISGSIFATEYSVTSSITNIVIATKSGSTEFGNSQDDSHTFTGNITASNNITASGLFADKIRAGIYTGSSIFDIAAGIGGIDTDGLVSCDGISNSSTYAGSGRIVVIGSTSYIETPSYVSASEIITINITSSGNISASGDHHVLGGDLTVTSFKTDKIIPPSDTLQLGNDAGLQFIILKGNVTALTASIENKLTINNNHISIEGSGNESQRISGSNKLSYHSPQHEFTPSLNSLGQTSFFKVSGDSHFTSHITSSGNISASGIIHGESFRVDGARITKGPINYGFPDGGLNVGKEITASGNISSSVAVQAAGLEVHGKRIAYVDPDLKIMDTGLFVAGGHITSSGNISASGKFIGNELNFAGPGTGNDYIRLINNSVNIKSNDASITLAGNVTASNNISASGNIYGDDLIASGELFTTGIGVNKIEGLLTLGSATIPAGGNNLRVEGTSTFTSHITASGNISSSGFTVAQNFATPGQIYLNSNVLDTGTDYIEYNNGGFFYKGKGDFHTNLEVGTTLLVNSHITASGNISSSADIYAQDYYSNGQQIIDYDGEKIRVGNVPLNIPGNITASGNISSSGEIHALDYKIAGGKSAIDYVVGTTQIIYGQNNQNARLRGNEIELGEDATQHVTASGNISSSGTIIGSNLSGENSGDQNITNLAVTGSDVIFANITSSGNISASGYISASGTVVGSNTIRVANTKRFQGAQINTANAGDWLHSDNEGESKDDNYDNTIGTTGITSGTTTITTNIAARGSKYVVPTATTASKWTGIITHTSGLDLTLGLWKVTPVDNNAGALTLNEITGEVLLEGKGNSKMRTFSVDVHPDSGSLSPGDLIVPLIKRESGTSSGVAHFNSTLLFYTEI